MQIISLPRNTYASQCGRFANNNVLCCSESEACIPELKNIYSMYTQIGKTRTFYLTKRRSWEDVSRYIRWERLRWSTGFGEDGREKERKSRRVHIRHDAKCKNSCFWCQRSSEYIEFVNFTCIPMKFCCMYYIMYKWVAAVKTAFQHLKVWHSFQPALCWQNMIFA